MAGAGGMRERTRSARTFSRNRAENEEDCAYLDANKDATENAYDILSNIIKKQGPSDVRKTALLNLFIKLMVDVKSADLPLAITKREIFCCLRVGLVSSNTAVRAATLRVLRHSINDAADVAILNKLQVPHLIARSIDLVVKNDHERIQALRLALRMLNLAPQQFSQAVTRSLVALVNGACENKDRMSNSALFLLCQLCVLNGESAIECGGETCLLRCCLETAQGKIKECLVGCLLFLLNKPETRNRAHLRIDYLTSVYCDLQRKRAGEGNMLSSSKLSVMAAIRSWSGIFHLCNPENESTMKAVINVLYLRDPELRKGILELLCDMFGCEGDYSEGIEIAMSAADPYQPRDSWRLSEKFVAGEGRDILPHHATTRPNVTEVHMAFLLYSMLECGILAALVEVSVTADASLSTQAIVLLGYLLYLSHCILPSELLDVSPSLPSLVEYVTQGEGEHRVRAMMVMTALQKIHNMLTRPIAPASLFLRHHISYGDISKKKEPGGPINKKGPGSDADSGHLKSLDVFMKNSDVCIHRDPRYWLWRDISTILKCRNASLMKLDDVQYKTILKKLLHFYKPSSSQFSSVEYSFRDPQNAIYATTALDFLDLLLEFSSESEGHKMAQELIQDIGNEFNRLAEGGETIFIPNKLTHSLCQHYFLMVGHLTRSPRGLALLERANILQTLLVIVENTRQDLIIKLIVSSLCYHHSSVSRKMLSRGLTNGSEAIRVYCTGLLLVLARCEVPMFHKWGLDMLLPQMYDSNKLVAETTIDILHELSYNPTILDCLIETRPSLLHLGDKGQLLLIRFLSTPAGFSFLSESNFIEKEMGKWEKSYNLRYVGLLEGAIHDAITLHQREDNGKYSRRLTNAKHRWKPVWVPPHLYGQLAAHPAGMALLESSNAVNRLAQKLQLAACSSDEEILSLKASLWALSNMGATTLGLDYLQERGLVEAIVSIAQTCPVLSLRATAFYCLSLIATSPDGAAVLSKLDWLALRRPRSNRWLLEEESRDRSHNSDEDVLSSLAFSVDSVEDLASFMEPPLTKTHVFAVPKRASTLPPGLSGDMDEVDFSTSPPTTRSRHQRSYSETCSLQLRQHCQDPTTPQRLSMEDAAGMATLHSLHAARRPELSSNNLFPQTSVSRFTQQRPTSPLTEFEAENPLRLFCDPVSCGDVDVPNAGESNQGPPTTGAYCGICLPRSLTQLMTLTDRKEEKRRKRGSVSFSEMELVKEEEKAESSSSGEYSDSDVKPGQTSRKKRAWRHNGAGCLACCTKTRQRTRKVSSSSFRLRTDTESSYGNAPDGSPVSLKWRLKATSEGGSGESASCGEETAAPGFLTPSGSTHTTSSVIRVRRDVLKYVGRMCNPVWAKATRVSLLQLRQSHQAVFHDICLYSDVCSYLANCSCRVAARRFIQELFLDITFSPFYEDAETILSAYATEKPPTPPSPALSLRDEAPPRTPTLLSPTKNLSTVFENLSSCGSQSLQVAKLTKDSAPKT